MKRLVAIFALVLILTAPAWALSELKHTVAPSGTSPTPDFNTVEAAVLHLIASHADLVAADVYATIEIYGDWTGVSDTTSIYVHGLTVDATRYLSVYTVSAARHVGKWDATKYNLTITATANGDYGIGSDNTYVRWDGLQIKMICGAYTGCNAFTFGASGASDQRLSNTIIYSNSSTGYGINLAGGTCYIWNCVVYGGCLYGIRGGPTAASVYSCTLLGVNGGLRANEGTFVAKNVYCSGGGGVGDFYGTITMTNCASSDATAVGTDPHINIAHDTDTFVNVTAATADYHLAADGLSPLQGHGVDTTGDAAPLNFTVDIDGVTRDATWDIGADAWYVAAGGWTNMPAAFHAIIWWPMIP